MVSYILTSVLRTQIRLFIQTTESRTLTQQLTPLFPPNETLNTNSEVSRHKLFGFTFCGSNHSLRVLISPPHTHTPSIDPCVSFFSDAKIPCTIKGHHVIMQPALRRRGFSATSRPTIDYSDLTKRPVTTTHSHLIKTCHMKYVSFHCSRHNMY